MDCGEGTQLQMQKFGIRTRRIHHIFISHLHGDHYFGLIGLLTSMGLLGRTEAVNLYGPPQLIDIINLQLQVAHTELPYPVIFTAVRPGDCTAILDTEHYAVTCFPTIHRIPCHGFLFEEKSSGRKLLPEMCRQYEIPAAFYNRLKQGGDYTTKSGDIIKNEWVTAPPPPAKRYAFGADTLYTEIFLDVIKDIDALYHESTYLNDLAEKATMRFHSTALQAATIAQKAGVKRLLLGHFSSKYDDLSLFEKEARSLFPNSEATYEGMAFEI